MGEENQPKPIYRVLDSESPQKDPRVLPFSCSRYISTLSGGIKASIKGVTQVMWTYVKLLHRKEKKI